MIDLHMHSRYSEDGDFTPAELVEQCRSQGITGTIHRNGGKAVLAHPGVNLKGHEELLGEILDLGFDGVEAFSSYHTQQQAAEFYRQARERGLFATCGSDYHGKTKPSIHLGGYGDTGGAELFSF